MLNKLWPIFIIVSIIYGILTGKTEEINASIFDSAASAVELSITFLGTICLWNGFMQIVSKTTMIEKLTKILRPIMKFLFPDIQENDKAHEEMSMNIIANIMGLGNAATPMGLKAMKSLQRINPKKDTLSNSMAMFIVINTASLQLIPTTVIAIRRNLESTNPTGMMLPIWISSLSALISVIFATKLLQKKYK